MSSTDPTSVRRTRFFATSAILALLLLPACSADQRASLPTSPSSVTSAAALSDTTGSSAPADNGTHANSTTFASVGPSLTVSKTADTAFTRDYDWTIAKSANRTNITIDSEDTVDVNFSVVVTKDGGTDSNWTVGGTITVANPNATTAQGIVVTDTVFGVGNVAVSCPATSLAAGASMQCSYGPVTVPNGAPRANTATATTTTTEIASGSDTMTMMFDSPTTTVDNCVTVSDTYIGTGSPGVGANVCATRTFSYTRTLEACEEGCGPHTITNTASLATDDGATEQSSVTVNLTVNCPTEAGCTPGYWKNHVESWYLYLPSQSVESVFDVPDAYGLDSDTLMMALDYGGGNGTAGAARILLRAAVAALLNEAAFANIYPGTASTIIAGVNAALASNDRATMLSLAAQLDDWNNLGCPLPQRSK